MLRAGSNTFKFSKIVSGRLCPFIDHLLTGCYSSSMVSITVEEAIYYCGTNYGKCERYQLLQARGEDISVLNSQPGGDERV